MADIIKPIAAPSLEISKYGQNINDQFKNIDNNFKLVSNRDFVKGDSGESLYIENVEIIKGGEGIGGDLYNALKTAIENRFDSEGALKSINGCNWDDAVTQVGEGEGKKTGICVPIIASKDKTIDRVEYICAASPVMLFDNRFNENVIENVDFSKYEDVVDVTSILNFKKEDGEWVCELNLSYPRLQYKDGSFHWVINNKNTIVKSTGIKGDPGESANIWIVQTEDFSDNYEGEYVGISRYFDGGKWTFDAPKNIKDGDLAIVHCESKDKKYYGFFVSQIKIDDDNKTIAYYSNANIQNINYVKNTEEFFKSLGKGEAARGMFLKFNPGDKDSKYAHMFYNVGEKLYIKPTKDYSSLENYNGKENPGINITGYNTTNVSSKKISISASENIEIIKTDEQQGEIKLASGCQMSMTSKEGMYLKDDTNISIESNNINIKGAATVGANDDNDGVNEDNLNSTLGGIHAFAAPKRSNYLFGPNNPTAASGSNTGLEGNIQDWTEDFGVPKETDNNILTKGYPLVISSGRGGNAATPDNVGKLEVPPSYLVFGGTDILSVTESEDRTKYEKQTLCLNDRLGFEGQVKIGRGGLNVSGGGLTVNGATTLNNDLTVSGGKIDMKGATLTRQSDNSLEINASGVSITGGNLTISRGSGLTVSGVTELNKLTVSGETTLNNVLTIKNNGNIWQFNSEGIQFGKGDTLQSATISVNDTAGIVVNSNGFTARGITNVSDLNVAGDINVNGHIKISKLGDWSTPAVTIEMKENDASTHFQYVKYNDILTSSGYGLIKLDGNGWAYNGEAYGLIITDTPSYSLLHFAISVYNEDGANQWNNMNIYIGEYLPENQIHDFDVPQNSTIKKEFFVFTGEGGKPLWHNGNMIRYQSYYT